MTLSLLEQAWEKRRQSNETVAGDLTATQLDGVFQTITDNEIQRQVLRFLAMRWPKTYTVRLLSSALTVSETKAGRALRSLLQEGALIRLSRKEYSLGGRVLPVCGIEPQQAVANAAPQSSAVMARGDASIRSDRLNELHARHRLQSMFSSPDEDSNLSSARLVLAAHEDIIGPLNVHDCALLLGCSEVEAAVLHEEIFVRHPDQYSREWAREQLFRNLKGMSP